MTLAGEGGVAHLLAGVQAVQAFERHGATGLRSTHVSGLPLHMTASVSRVLPTGKCGLPHLMNTVGSKDERLNGRGRVEVHP